MKHLEYVEPYPNSLLNFKDLFNMFPRISIYFLILIYEPVIHPVIHQLQTSPFLPTNDSFINYKRPHFHLQMLPSPDVRDPGRAFAAGETGIRLGGPQRRPLPPHQCR